MSTDMQRKRNSNATAGRSRVKGASAPRSRRRGRTRFGSSLPSYNPLVAPVNTAVATTVGPTLGFGIPAPHDEFPQGGIRITGTMANTTTDSLWDSGTTAAKTGIWYATAAANQYAVAAISPTAYVIATAFYNYCMFGSSTAAIPTICQFFRRFRFRKLSLIWEGATPTSQGGMVTIGYERDTNSAYANATQTMNSSAAQGQTACRFPVWTPLITVPLIKESKSGPSDELFALTAADDGMTGATQSAAVLNQYAQGGVYAVWDNHVTTGQTLLAHYRWEFVLDLYGFTPLGNVSLSLAENRDVSEELRICRARELEKKEKKRAELVQELNSLASKANGRSGRQKGLAGECAEEKDDGSYPDTWVELREVPSASRPAISDDRTELLKTLERARSLGLLPVKTEQKSQSERV